MPKNTFLLTTPRKWCFVSSSSSHEGAGGVGEVCTSHTTLSFSTSWDGNASLRETSVYANFNSSTPVIPRGPLVNKQEAHTGVTLDFRAYAVDRALPLWVPLLKFPYCFFCQQHARFGRHKFINPLVFTSIIWGEKTACGVRHHKAGSLSGRIFLRKRVFVPCCWKLWEFVSYSVKMLSCLSTARQNSF